MAFAVVPSLRVLLEPLPTRGSQNASAENRVHRDRGGAKWRPHRDDLRSPCRPWFGGLQTERRRPPPSQISR